MPYMDMTFFPKVVPAVAPGLARSLSLFPIHLMMALMSAAAAASTTSLRQEEVSGTSEE